MQDICFYQKTNGYEINCIDNREVSRQLPTPTPEPIVTPAAPDAINGAIKNTAGAEGNLALVTLSTLAAACVFVAEKKRKAE